MYSSFYVNILVGVSGWNSYKIWNFHKAGTTLMLQVLLQSWLNTHYFVYWFVSASTSTGTGSYRRAMAQRVKRSDEHGQSTAGRKPSYSQATEHQPQSQSRSAAAIQRPIRDTCLDPQTEGGQAGPFGSSWFTVNAAIARSNWKAATRFENAWTGSAGKDIGSGKCKCKFIQNSEYNILMCVP